MSDMQVSISIPEAEYVDPILHEYRNNPLICCLPPVPNQKQVISNLRLKPHFDKNEKNLDGRLRAHAIARVLGGFFQPLAHHLQLEEKLSLMIRQGYLGRNPNSGDYHAHLQNGFERVLQEDLDARVFEHPISTASGISLIGCSGCGKSKTMERILRMYPQAVYHPNYNITQLAYIKLNCPIDGDLDELCLSFFNEVDRVLPTRYSTTHGRKKLGTKRLLASMCQIANLHALGVLVIDEIQNLNEAKSGGAQKMHNFFAALEDSIGIPVIQIGTFRARRFFDQTLSGARRTTGYGSLVWDRLPKNRQWDKLMASLWKYQWLQQAAPVDEALKDKMYDCTQGVMDIVVKLFALAQMRAIVTGAERLTPELLQQVYGEELRPVHPMLAALRTGNADLIAKYDDLVMPEVEARLISISPPREPLSPQPLASPSTNQVDQGKSKKLLSALEFVGMPKDVAVPLVDELLKIHPDLPIMALVHKATEYASEERPKEKKPRRISRSEWINLPSDDLRWVYAKHKGDDIHQVLKEKGAIYDLQGLIAGVG